MKVYPVFKPNQYFFDNHCAGKTEKGDRATEYIRVVREEIMAKSFNFELSDVRMEDKFSFKDKLKGREPKQE